MTVATFWSVFTGVSIAIDVAMLAIFVTLRCGVFALARRDRGRNSMCWNAGRNTAIFSSESCHDGNQLWRGLGQRTLQLRRRRQ